MTGGAESLVSGDGTDADTDVDSDVDGDTDGDSDTDPDTDTDEGDDAATDAGDGGPDGGSEVPDASSEEDGGGLAGCDGVAVEGHCWFYGEELASCEETCADRGGFDPATRDYAGSGGTDDRCGAVLDALGAGGSTVYPLSGVGVGIGCASVSGARYRVSDEETTAEATYLLTRRACACGI